MTVLFFGTYEEDYPRNRILRSALALVDAQVIDCHVSIWRGRTHKPGLLGGAGAIGLALRLAWAYLRLAARYLRAPRHDVILIGYPGHLDALCAGFLRRLRGNPRLVFDAFVSLHDSAVGDR